MSEAVIFGSSRQGLVVLDVLRAQNKYTVVGFLDDDSSKHGELVDGVCVLGGMEWILVNVDRRYDLIIAIGNNEARIAISRKLRTYGIELLNAVHPSAVVMGGVSLGSGNLVAAGAIIGTGTCLENDVVVNTSASIDHDCLLHTGSYISPGVNTAGCVTIGQGAFIGIGAIIGPGVTIGANSIVGAGSLVLSNIPPNVLAFGSPARIVKELSEPINWHRILTGGGR